MGSEGAWSNQLVNLIILAASSAGFSGFFAYSPVPGHGNLFMSLAAAAGTDPYGNSYPLGLSVGKASDLSQVVLSPSGSGGSSEVQFPIPSLSLSNVPNLSSGPISGTFAAQVMSGPAMTGGTQDDWVQVIEFSNDTAGTFARGELRYIDVSGNVHILLDWGKSDQAIHIPAGGGPFIFGEAFHSISLPANFTGTAQVKKLPWNSIWLDVEVQTTATTSGGTTFTFGSLPDATYYPVTQRHFPVSMTGAFVATSGSFAGNVRFRLNTSGALVLEMPTLAAAALLTVGMSVTYPNN